LLTLRNAGGLARGLERAHTPLTEEECVVGAILGAIRDGRAGNRRVCGHVAIIVLAIADVDGAREDVCIGVVDVFLGLSTLSTVSAHTEPITVCVGTSRRRRRAKDAEVGVGVTTISRLTTVHVRRAHPHIWHRQELVARNAPDPQECEGYGERCEAQNVHGHAPSEVE